MAKCELCDSSEQNNILYGEFKRIGRIWVHEFCLYLSSGLIQNGEDDEGIFGFLPEDIKKERERVKKLNCCFCHKKYANIGCCETKCHKTFHFICGLKNGVENQFVGTFRSYCIKHLHKDKRKSPKPDEICCICYDPLEVKGKKNLYVNRIKAPCCNNGWFHKSCLQYFAQSAGYFFKCPLCNDSEIFRQRIPYLGVFVPNRDAAWELEPNAFADLLQRPRKCEAEICRNRKGREDIDDERNPLLCCSTCGALSTAVHKFCLPRGQQNFNCPECEAIVEALPSVTEGDSGRESLHAIFDEEIEVDVCNVSESEGERDDSSSVGGQKLCKKNHQVISDSSDNQEEDTLSVRNFNYSPPNNHDDNDGTDDEIKSFATKAKDRRFFYDTSTEEDAQSSVQISQDGNEIFSDGGEPKKLARKRKYIVESDSSSSSDNSKENETENATPNTDDEDDPLEFLDKLISKKRRVQRIKTTKPSDPPPQSSRNRKPNINNTKTQQNEYDSLSSESSSSLESSYRRNCFENSCIANRTRRRQRTICLGRNSICSSLSTVDTSECKNRKSNRTSNKRVARSSYSSCNSNEDGEDKPVSLLDISCIARRTRRRKSITNCHNNLGTIGEETMSGSSEFSRSSRINDADHSKDDGFSSDFSTKDCRSSFLNIYSIPKNNEKLNKRRLRLVSLTSEEEFDENDAMKNR